MALIRLTLKSTDTGQEWKLSKICNTNNALILWIKDFNRRKVFRRFWWIKFLSMILVSPFKWLRLPSLDLDDSFWNNTHGKLLNLSTWIKINLGVFEIVKGQLAKHWLYRQTSQLNSIFLCCFLFFQISEIYRIWTFYFRAFCVDKICHMIKNCRS